MIERRFVNIGKNIFQNMEWWCSAGSEHCADVIAEALNMLCEENEQLKRKKERYKRLSEIRDEVINNRILILKEFINNCEDEKVKNVLEDFFYSEVKEYDLAKENRKLNAENEQLKQNNDYAVKLTAEFKVQNDKLKKEKAKLKHEKEILMSFRKRTIKTLQQVKDNSPDDSLTGYLTVLMESIADELEVDLE